MTLIWKGDAVVRHVEIAAAGGMSETVDAAIEEARPETPVNTGATRDSLHRDGEGLRLRWGYGTPWGIWAEIGSRGHAGAHALRRAADRQYARLPARIRRRLVG
jgi:hypothetical protein